MEGDDMSEVDWLRDDNARLRAERKLLDRRVHNQRRALRETWEIVEMRRKWLGSSVAREIAAKRIRENRALREENAALQAVIIWLGSAGAPYIPSPSTRKASE